MDKNIKMYENKEDKTGAKGEDRRSQRSQQALIEALIDLMATRPYDSISIKEIVDRANVGRSTFYAHYQTKDDLVMSGFERLLDETVKNVVISKSKQDLTVDVTMVFQHAAGHYHIYKTLMWGTGYKILTIDEHNVFSEKLRQHLSVLFPDESKISVPLDVLSVFFSGNLLILLRWWLDNKMPYPPEKMNDLFQILAMPGIKSALVGRMG
jgi:AcrR family transcriptional regulator